ncbi:MAG: TylF/MycF/NovP-related O-methyltransferase [Bacteroidota bacterium]
MKYIFKKIFNKFGYSDVPQYTQSDFESDFLSLAKSCLPYTMTSPERLYAIYKSIEYIAKNKLEGDIVECGVWRGGSIMCALQSLVLFNDKYRDIYLYDTFEGMSLPSEKDVDLNGIPANHLLAKRKKSPEDIIWAFAPLEEVKKNISQTSYPIERIHFVKGKVEETIPVTLPEKISMLRLDTDWYDSTYHELVHLFPRLIKGGVLIIDDYGHWKGAKEAVDQYVEENHLRVLLNRIDYTGRILIKQ